MSLQDQFKTIFGNAEPKPEDIVKALAAFVRTIQSGDSPWDRHEKGDKDAVSKDVETNIKTSPRSQIKA